MAPPLLSQSSGTSSVLQPNVSSTTSQGGKIMKWTSLFAAVSLFSSAAFGINQEGYITNMGLYAQQQSEWCWAGVTATVGAAFGKPKSECKMASRFIKGQPGEYCCAANKGSSKECNQPYFLDKSLAHYGFLDQMFASQIGTLNIIQDLKKRLPVNVRIGWDNGGGHFMVIYGAKYVGTAQTFNVWNPLPVGKGDKQVLSRAALVRYRSSGNWTHSYTTKRPG